MEAVITMTGFEAVTLVRKRLLDRDVPHDVANAVGEMIDHILRLEQALSLIRAGVTSALNAMPDNAVLRGR